MKPFHKKCFLHIAKNISLPKLVAKEIVFSILSEGEDKISPDDSKIYIEWVADYWKPFAKYWNKDIIIDEETDSVILSKFMGLSESRKKYLVTRANFVQLVPKKDREAYFSYLESISMDDEWKANTYLTRMSHNLYDSDSVEYTKKCEIIMKEKLDISSDDLTIDVIAELSSSIVKVYLKHGQPNLAKAHIDFLSKTSFVQPVFSLKLLYYTYINDLEAINKLKENFLTTKQVEKDWTRQESETKFYTKLCLYQLHTNQRSSLVNTICKLIDLFDEIENEAVRKNILWQWTRFFIRSRQNNLHNEAYPYGFRFNLYKKLLEIQTTTYFDLIQEITSHKSFYYDENLCAPTILLDLCLEALLISVDKYEEAYDLCIELITRATELNEKNTTMIRMYFSMAFDIYIKTHNQQVNIPTEFLATQRFED